MFVTLQTYDWKSAKPYLDKSGITSLPKKQMEHWKETGVDAHLIDPFKRMGNFLRGVIKLAQPDLEKELNSTVDKINALQEKLEGKESISESQLKELESLSNKFLKLAKKSGDEGAIRDATKLKEDFERKYKRNV